MNHEIWAECPTCGHEFDRHLHWDNCPNCGKTLKTANCKLPTDFVIPIKKAIAIFAAQKKTRAMRPINEIIIHCTGTVPSHKTTVASVRDYHVKTNGWKDIGYHYLVTLDGEIHAGRPLDQAGAHCSGHNANTIGVCYVGGLGSDRKPKDTRNMAQTAALNNLVHALKISFPSIKKVSGHYMYNKSKPCPCFDVAKEFGR